MEEDNGIFFQNVYGLVTLEGRRTAEARDNGDFFIRKPFQKRLVRDAVTRQFYYLYADVEHEFKARNIKDGRKEYQTEALRIFL